MSEPLNLNIKFPEYWTRFQKDTFLAAWRENLNEDPPKTNEDAYSRIPQVAAALGWKLTANYWDNEKSIKKSLINHKPEELSLPNTDAKLIVAPGMSDRDKQIIREEISKEFIKQPPQSKEEACQRMAEIVKNLGLAAKPYKRKNS